ncbi:Os01g0284601 [Oryza sativa Japonica Group]|uniref:Os01g0284601 protein n=1 Tax=Oryza sativa subsp. japonica TaxID=39947 RepID=A0A0P0V1X0_ORYSJ|nr:hypothetical protein DAI22_01g130000 [Oryza sativa Japonica Group]BAS71619.1 Os01g0284601 [Oryza sativa Japonica Group]
MPRVGGGGQGVPGHSTPSTHPSPEMTAPTSPRTLPPGEDGGSSADDVAAAIGHVGVAWLGLRPYGLLPCWWFPAEFAYRRIIGLALA